MPLYEFQCRSCQRVFEMLVRRSRAEEERPTCPHCGAPDAERVLSASAVVTEGGGGGCAPRGGFT